MVLYTISCSVDTIDHQFWTKYITIILGNFEDHIPIEDILIYLDNNYPNLL
jgi:hypothetical protein